MSPAISSAALIGIGLLVTVERLVERPQDGVDLARALEVAGLGGSQISRICGPTRWEATWMPPASPSSSVFRKMSSLPASTASPSIGPSSSLFACLTPTTLSIFASSASPPARC